MAIWYIPKDAYNASTEENTNLWDWCIMFNLLSLFSSISPCKTTHYRKYNSCVFPRRRNSVFRPVRQAGIMSFPIKYSAYLLPCCPLCRLGPWKTISCSNTAIILAEWDEAPATSPGNCQRMTGWVISSPSLRHIILTVSFRKTELTECLCVCRCCGQSSSTRNAETSERPLGVAGIAQ